MMIGIRQVMHVDRFNRTTKHDVLQMRCDTCGKEWEMRGSKTRVMSRKTHACSLNCKSNAHKHGGIVERLRAATNIKKFGAENPFASEICKEKITNTWRKKYGVDHARSSRVVKQKVKTTMIERYGVEHPMNSSILRAKQVATMQKNWGVSYPMQLKHVQDALVAGSIKKYGVPYAMQNIEHQKSVFSQRDGISWMSKQEKAFRVLLEKQYGKDDVKVQRLLERRWSVDFYVKSIDTWISFDGVYWHGLDRPIEEIRESTKPRDVAICRKWQKDRELDSYMKERKMQLIRITDKEFIADPQSCLLKVCR